MTVQIKDSRYKTICILLEGGNIERVANFINHIPSSIIANDMGVNIARLNYLIEHPDQFSLDEMHRLADLIDCDHSKVCTMLYNEVRLK